MASTQLLHACSNARYLLVAQLVGYPTSRPGHDTLYCTFLEESSQTRFTTVTDMTTIDDPTIRLPHLTLQTAIGICVAIAGNILISLALNLQKLAHRRLDRKVKSENGAPACNEHRDHCSTRASPNGAESHWVAPGVLPLESQPLIHPRSRSVPPTSSYGSRNSDTSLAGDDTRSRVSTTGGRSRRRPRKPTLTSRLAPLRLNFGISSNDPVRENSLVLDSGVIPEDVIPKKSGQNRQKRTIPTSEDREEGDYLRSKLWSAFVSIVEFLAFSPRL